MSSLTSCYRLSLSTILDNKLRNLLLVGKGQAKSGRANRLMDVPSPFPDIGRRSFGIDAVTRVTRGRYTGESSAL
jgi:hypothetical protein